MLLNIFVLKKWDLNYSAVGRTRKSYVPKGNFISKIGLLFTYNKVLILFDSLCFFKF